MKVRTGFVSNSSSSSFLIFSKEDTLYNALMIAYDELFSIPDDFNKETTQYRFLTNLKQDWVDAMNDCEYNDFYDVAHDERTVAKIDSEEDMRLYLDKHHLTDENIALVKDGWNIFHLDIPDYGEGGTVLQHISRYSIGPFIGKNIIIKEDC